MSTNPLAALLAPLRLYRLGAGSLVDGELAAYGAGFTVLEEAIRLLQDAARPTAASGEFLALHEIAAGLPPMEDVPDEIRRRIITLRKNTPASGGMGDLLIALEGCGLIGPKITQEDGHILLSAEGFLPGLSQAQILEMALRLMPAHIPARFGNTANTWDALDAAMPSWDALDLLGRSWDLLAAIGV